MKKLFNRTTLKIFIPMLIVFFLAGTGMFICRAYMNAKVEELIVEDSGGKDSELTNKIAGFLVDTLKKYADKSGVDIGDTDADEQPEYSRKTLSAMSKRTTFTVLGIIFYALTLVFVGLSITSGAYSSYLESDKYKAKLRRLETAEKRKASMK